MKNHWILISTLMGSLILTACTAATENDPWRVQGEIPFDGKLVYQK